MDRVCLQKTRFHANPAPGTEPVNGRQTPWSAWSKPPYFVANQPVLRGFWGLALQIGGLDSKSPCFAQTSSFVGGLEGVGAMKADEFNFLWSDIQNYIAEADADLIPVPG